MRNVVPRLFQLFSHEDRLLILIDPDPDAIASALALKRLLWHRLTSCTIAPIRPITRPQNQRMVQLLSIALTPLQKLNPEEYNRKALVDNQPAHHKLFGHYHYAPLSGLVLNLLDEGCEIHAMRDPTRGGIAAALNEIARQSQVSMEIFENRVPVQPAVAAACEALGLDVFKVANEGKMLILVAPEDAAKALFIIRRSPYGETARVIGKVGEGPAGRVQVRTVIGTARILDPPSGDLLPRIC